MPHHTPGPRRFFALIFTTYSATLPLLKTDWNMSASQAGLIQSAWHAGYMISLFLSGILMPYVGWQGSFIATACGPFIAMLIAFWTLRATPTELVPLHYLGAAYALRSLLGFGAGIVSPWVFGLVIDWTRGEPLRSETMAWGLAWTALGIGAALGPLMTFMLRAMPESQKMASGKR